MNYTKIFNLLSDTVQELFSSAKEDKEDYAPPYVLYRKKIAVSIKELDEGFLVKGGDNIGQTLLKFAKTPQEAFRLLSEELQDFAGELLLLANKAERGDPATLRMMGIDPSSSPSKPPHEQDPPLAE